MKHKQIMFLFVVYTFVKLLFIMGAAESTQCANYDILQKDDQFFSPFGWELHHAKSKVDGSFVSIFKSNTKSDCISNG